MCELKKQKIFVGTSKIVVQPDYIEITAKKHEAAQNGVIVSCFFVFFSGYCLLAESAAF
jgi:hypothetical protein